MMRAGTTVRVARPASDVQKLGRLYAAGLGWEVLGGFTDHEGFDGVMVGRPGEPIHLEFTHHRGFGLRGAPTPEDLLVFYIEDAVEWAAACHRMETAGFRPVTAYNPYWDRAGRTFQDPEGYRVVLQQGSWAG